MLWNKGIIISKELWTFAYEDGNKAYFPKAIKDASIYEILDQKIWLEKYRLITQTYGFDTHSWEAQTTPKEEAFNQI